jgi:hypothetical protein
MKNILFILILFTCAAVQAQSPKIKPPSYFGFQVRPIFPTSFIGSPEMSHQLDGFETTITQRAGYSFGGTVRVGLTKLIALETGINFTQRHFDLNFGVPDSNSFGSDRMSFIEYDVPLNGLVYIRLADQWYMNASIGFAITFKPTHVGTFNQPGGFHTYTHTGLVRSKAGFDANANVGFEFRTKKKGFFYLGGSARVPFSPLFDLVSDYQWQGNITRMFGEVDGSFLAIDFKYFFPNIRNKGIQFIDGPIE